MNKEQQTKLSNLSDYANIEALEVALEEMKKKKIIQEHEKNNKIFSSNGKWYTHYQGTDGIRHTLVRNTREELEEVLLNKLNSEKENIKTFKNVFPQWISFKKSETSLANANKLEWVWNKYIASSELINKAMDSITVSELKQILIEICRQYSLTSTQAKELKSVINMMYDFAIENDWIVNNLSRSIHGFANENKDYITIARRKDLEEEVFSEKEEALAIKKCLEYYSETNNTIYLGIVLNFLLGLRAGELIACQFGDFNFKKGILHLCRSEVRAYSEDGQHKQGFEVKPYLKKHVAFRDIPVGEEVKKIVEMIRKANIKAGFEDSDWMFLDKDGQRRHAKAIDKALSRINVHASIVQKSNHKIRKTVISSLIASGQMDIVTIRDFAGHKDGMTTLKFYGRNLSNSNENSAIVDSVLGSKIAI